MSFSCILLYCIDLSFLIENFQLKANNSFECTKTEPTNYQYSLKLYYDWQRCHAMRGSRSFPGIFVRGEGGVQVSLTKKSSDNVFFFFLVLSLFDISQMVIFFKFFKVPEGVQHFQGGSNFFQWGDGVQLLIPYRNLYNL